MSEIDRYDDLEIAVRPAAVKIVDMPTLFSFLDLLHMIWREDAERGHSLNDEMRDRVLVLCSRGHEQAAELARAVLVTNQWTDVASWCA